MGHTFARICTCTTNHNVVPVTTTQSPAYSRAIEHVLADSFICGASMVQDLHCLVLGGARELRWNTRKLSLMCTIQSVSEQSNSLTAEGIHLAKSRFGKIQLKVQSLVKFLSIYLIGK